MRKKNRLVCGAGINDYDGVVNINGRLMKSYKNWCSMLYRCYSRKWQDKSPTYIGCTVGDEWLYFTNFKKWFDENYVEGYQLDKDIKFKGNKIYSPETCFFVTRELNSLLTHKKSNQGESPTGVSLHSFNGKYQAQVTLKGKIESLGCFLTAEEAEKVYLTAKGNEIIRQSMLPTTPDGLRTALIRRGNDMLANYKD